MEDLDHPDGRPRALEPHQTAEEHQSIGFARTIAQRLSAAGNARRFDALVLVAEPRFLGLLRGALDHGTQQRVRGEVRKHLVTASDADIAKHLADPALLVAG